MSDTNVHLLEVYPAWRQAVQDFVVDGFKGGDTVDFDWLYQHFHIQRPLPQTPLEQAQRAELQFLAAFDAFKECLLTDYQIALASVRGVGYKIVPPREQTEWAEKDGYSEIRKVYRKLGNRLSNVALDQLTVDERRKNADALARHAMLRAMVRKISRGKAIEAPAGDKTEAEG